MLRYIECEHFVEKRITFHERLNIIVGDVINSNSIGKSTALKIIDFVYGGKTLVTHGQDVPAKLGHHDYTFLLELDQDYLFTRNTQNPTSVTYHNKETGKNELWSLDDYLNFLENNYTDSIPYLSFREIVGPVSRVWGRENLIVSKPLHVVAAQNGSSCVDYLIKIFDRYRTLSDWSFRRDSLTDEKKALNSAFKKSIVPKINKSKYTANRITIDNNKAKIEDIKTKMSLFAISVNELVNETVLEQKIQKHGLLDLKMLLDDELERLKSNLENTKAKTAKNFEPLLEIIPSVNIDKLLQIESFHNGLIKILAKEIKEKEKEITEQIAVLETQIQDCNRKILIALKGSENPAYIVDSVTDISLETSHLSKENELYEQFSDLNENIRRLNELLKEGKIEILEKIENTLNQDIKKLVDFIYGESRTSPRLKLDPSGYSFQIPQDTGTGKAYSNLILLDASMLRHTKIPYLIHDSLVFKNVENIAIENILHVYRGLTQQSFIALDGEILNSKTAASIIKDCKVLELNSGKLLYTLDWRADSSSNEIF